MSLFDSLPSQGATISPDGLYRYRLWRRWSGGDSVAFVGLNPSTADATVDDPTIRRCVRFAKDLGFGALEMVNLYAFRTTYPDELAFAINAIGIDNDTALLGAFDRAALVICAWGAQPRIAGRVADVVGMADGMPLYCLGTTKDGHPRHPLYLPATAKPQSWSIK